MPQLTLLMPSEFPNKDAEWFMWGKALTGLPHCARIASDYPSSCGVKGQEMENWVLKRRRGKLLLTCAEQIWRLSIRQSFPILFSHKVSLEMPISPNNNNISYLFARSVFSRKWVTSGVWRNVEKATTNEKRKRNPRQILFQGLISSIPITYYVQCAGTVGEEVGKWQSRDQIVDRECSNPEALAG